ncbi:hypothetical protein ACVV2G_10525 [Streptomyces ziwulingensis]
MEHRGTPALPAAAAAQLAALVLGCVSGEWSIPDGTDEFSDTARRLLDQVCTAASTA